MPRPDPHPIKPNAPNPKQRPDPNTKPSDPKHRPDPRSPGKRGRYVGAPAQVAVASSDDAWVWLWVIACGLALILVAGLGMILRGPQG